MLLFSCSNDDETTPAAETGQIAFQLFFDVDGDAILFDSICHVNAAGNEYEVTTLQFILSDFRFHRADQTYYADTNAFYVDARDPDFTGFTVENIPSGTYTSMSFTLGLDSVLNQTGRLPNTMEFVGMAWPDAMGGGYHFMKLEGHFRDGANLPGFAMHLGMTMNRIRYAFSVPVTVDGNTTTMALSMNVNQWFESPEVYDFDVDPNYSMGDQQAMAKLATNGADVFTLILK
jgi:hypothetical protein